MNKKQITPGFRIKILFVLTLFLLSGCVTTSKAPKPQVKKSVLDDVLVFRDLQQVDLDNDGTKDIIAIYSTTLNSSGVKVIKFDKDKGDVVFERVFNNPPNVKFMMEDNIPTLIVEETIQATGRKLKSIYRWNGKAFTLVGK
jgi:PBP1b-binding outer membrane lipoprotein LpoB